MTTVASEPEGVPGPAARVGSTGDDVLHALRFGPSVPSHPAPRAVGPAVLVHGQPGRAEVWHGVGAALAARGLAALAVDRPGYGRTGGAATGFAGNADALAGFLDHHDLDRVTVVAHSWAAGAALSMAARHPDRVGALVLLAPVGAPGSVNAMDHLLAVPLVGWSVLRSGLRVGAWALDRDRTRRLLPRGFGDLDPMAAKRMAGSAQSRGARRSAALEQRALVSELPGVRAGLGELDVPTVVLAGTHDLIIPTSAAHHLAAAIPGARLHLVEAGHLLPAEVPELVAEIVVGLSGPEPAPVPSCSSSSGR